MAKKAAWKFAKEHNIDLVTILPTVIVGPMLNTRSGFSVDVAKASSLAQNPERSSPVFQALIRRTMTRIPMTAMSHQA